MCGWHLYKAMKILIPDELSIHEYFHYLCWLESRTGRWCMMLLKIPQVDFLRSLHSCFIISCYDLQWINLWGGVIDFRLPRKTIIIFLFTVIFCAEICSAFNTWKWHSRFSQKVSKRLMITTLKKNHNLISTVRFSTFSAFFESSSML